MFMKAIYVRCMCMCVCREQIVYSAECLRRFTPLLIPLLIGNVLFPRFLPWELKSNEQKLLHARQRAETNADYVLSECLHAAAWHGNTLGLKLHATPNSLKHFNENTLRNFMLQHFYPGKPNNP